MGLFDKVFPSPAEVAGGDVPRPAPADVEHLYDMDGATGAMVRAFAGQLADEFSGRLSLPLVQLADLLGNAQNVRPVPAATWQPMTVALIAGAPPVQLVGDHPARRCVTILAATSLVLEESSSAVVWVGSKPGTADDLSTSFPLSDGATITIESRSEIWARSASLAYVSLIIEQDDPE